MKRKFEVSAITNNQTYYDYLYRVKKICTARFKWINIPDSWDPDFLENTLYMYGMCGVIWDNDYGNILTKIAIDGDLNIYDMPTRCNCYGIHMHKSKYVYNGVDIADTDPDKECVVMIKNNPDMRPTVTTIELFCRRLYEIERTIDVNLKQQKTPAIITCDPKQRLTLLNLYQQYDGNQPFIFGDKNLLGEANLMRAIDTEAPYLIDKLTAHKQAVWNELLTFLGINNVNFEKKERLITAEAESNNHFINLNLMNEFKCRKRACEQINKYFGLNIDVEINKELTKTGGNVDNMDKNVESGDVNE